MAKKLLVALCCAIGLWSATAYAEPPAVKLLSAPGVSPTAAWGYYDSTPMLHTTGAASAWASGRPPELVALARSLGSEQLAAGKISAGAYAQNVFDYVRNNIDTEFRFGLAKGARGAIIDQSGTPFDQAHLMVELLRQGGVTANYQVGTISLSASQFGKWTGLVHTLTESAQDFYVNAKAACQFLADGGIPVVIGSTSDCTALSGDLPSLVDNAIALGHIWVVANGNLYDPAFKRYKLRAGIDVAAAMDCASTCGAQARNALGATPGASVLQNLNDPQLYSNLRSWAIALESYVETNRPDAAVEEIVGGRRFDATFEPVVSSSLPYAANANYTWSGDIPNQFRSRIQTVIAGSQFEFFADEIDGGRITFFQDPCPTGCGAGQMTMTLRFEGEAIAQFPATAWPPTGHSVVLPYRIAGSVSQFAVAGTEVFWGDVGPGRVAHMADLIRSKPLHYYASWDETWPTCEPPPYTPAPDEHCTPLGYAFPIESHQGALYVEHEQAPLAGPTWFATFMHAKRLVEGISKTRANLHFTAGSGASHSLSYDTALSIASVTSNAGSAYSAFETLGAFEVMLEGVSLQQGTGAWRPKSALSGLVFSEEQGGRLISTTDGAGNNVIMSDDVPTVWLNAAPSCTTCGPFMVSAAGNFTYRQGHLWIGAKGASSVGGPNDPLKAALASAERQTANRRGGDVSASLATGDISLTPAADLVSGAGQFPHSLPFIRSYNSGHGSGLTLGLWTFQTPWYSKSAGPDAQSYSRLGGGWSHNYQISARLGADSSAALGDARGSDAASAIAAMHVFYDLHRNSPDFAARVTGIFAAHWAGLSLDDNTVTITSPSGAKKFVRRADGTSFSSPLGGSEQLIRTGARTGPFRTGDGGFYQPSADIAYSYVDVRLEYRAADGSVMVFEPGHKQDTIVGKLGNGGARYYLVRPYFVPASWTFADGVRVDFEYGWIADGTLGYYLSGGQPMGENPPDPNGGYRQHQEYKALANVRNSLGRVLTIGGLTLGDGVFRIDSVTDENGRVASFARSHCASNNILFTAYTTNSADQLDCATFEAILPNGGKTIYEYTPPGFVYPSDPNEAMTPLAASGRPNYRLRRIYTPSDHTTPYQTIAYDDLMRVKSVTNVAGEKVDYLPGAVSTERWKRGQSIDPLGSVSTTIFNEDGAVTKSINPLGHTVRSAYDDVGRLVRAVQPAGNAEERTYDVRSNLRTTCLIPKERWDQTCNPGAGDILTSTAYVEGPTVRTCANLKTCNNPLSSTDALNNVTSYTWNANGDLEQILLPADVDGEHPQTEYVYTTYSAGGASFRLLTSIKEKKSAGENIFSTFAYNAANKYVLLSGTVDYGGLNLTTTLDFDAIGNLISVDGPRTDVIDVTRYQWDALRRLVIVTGADPDGSGLLVAPKSIVRFDADGLVNFNADLKDNGEWRGVVTQYDAVGRPVKVARPKTLDLGSGSITTPAQVAALTMKTIDPGDQFVQTAYDAAGRALVTTDGEGRKTYTVYDAAGQVERVLRAWQGNANGTGGTTNCASGSSLQQCYQTNVWSSNGKLLSVANAKGYITRYAYDGFDRLTRTSYPDCVSATDPNCAFTEIQLYDKNGNVKTSRNRAGQTFTFDYDNLGRLLKKVAPDRVESFRYHLLGQQICAETWAGGSSGATCGSGSPVTRTTQSWDNARRLSFETQMVGGQSRTIAYEYRDKVNRTDIVWPGPVAWRAVYSFDVLNRLSSVAADTDGNGSAETPLALYRHDALGQLTGVRRGVASWGAGAAATDIQWEADGDLGLLTHTFTGEPAADWTYKYDKSAKLISESKVAAFAYVPPQAQAISYTLGGAANAKAVLDQYSAAAGQTMSWDANGNRTTRGDLTTTHDSENRLIQAVKGEMTVNYIYDALNRRVMKDFVTGIDTVFLSAGDTEIAEYDGATLVNRYVPGLRTDDLVAMITGDGAISYYHPDRLGNVVAVSNASGQVAPADHYKYTPFGIECGPNVTCDGPSASGNLFRYTGRRYDPETGLYYYRARYYDPSEAGGGRFLETDPVGYADQMNLYAYVANDPVNATDPTGRICVPCVGGIVGGFVGGVANAGMYTLEATKNKTFTLGGFGANLAEGVVVGATVGSGAGWVPSILVGGVANVVEKGVTAFSSKNGFRYTQAAKGLEALGNGALAVAYDAAAGGFDAFIGKVAGIGAKGGAIAVTTAKKMAERYGSRNWNTAFRDAETAVEAGSKGAGGALGFALAEEGFAAAVNDATAQPRITNSNDPYADGDRPEPPDPRTRPDPRRPW